MGGNKDEGRGEDAGSGEWGAGTGRSRTGRRGRALNLETAVEEDFKTREGPSHPGGWAHGQEPKGSPCE